MIVSDTDAAGAIPAQPSPHLPGGKIVPRSPLRLFVLGALLGLGACGEPSASPPRSSGVETALAIPRWGTDQTLDVATWNLSWFGDEGNGPVDEDLQLGNVRQVIAGADVDLWAVQEVVDQAAFERLMEGLPDYDGVLADDAIVDGGARWYRGFGNREQKVALLYRRDVVEVVGARVILIAEDHAFAGRPPVEFRVRLRSGGTVVDAVVVVLHAKASAAGASWNRRRTAARALLAYLARSWPTMPVWVLGDFNDAVEGSITSGRASPYADFVTAPDWSFVSGALSARGARSTVGHPAVIDHHLVSDEVAATYVTGSIEVFRVDRWVDRYATTTSDHLPVLARYSFGADRGGAPTGLVR